jgi:rhamnose transport system permease protein
MAASSVVAPSPPADAAPARAPIAERLFPNNEWVLLVVIVVECVVFGMAGHNFATAGNAFEIARLGVEIGLLAIAMTPIIVTGGIDLSVGSMMGLAAVVLGALWHDAGLSLPVAIAVTLLLGIAGGALNAVLITRLGFPPLIVTLGTLSLFRGIA